MFERRLIERLLRDVTQQLWGGMLDLDVVEACPLPRDRAERLSEMKGSVLISGAWQGEVSMQMSTALGERLARAMFCLPTDEQPDPAMVHDCLREVVNITAGNLKTTFPEPSILAIPTVSTSDCQSALTPVVQLDFACVDEPFRVTVGKERSVEVDCDLTF